MVSIFGSRRRQQTLVAELDPEGPRRLDIPVYLDGGVALSLAASLSRGVAVESSVETAIAKDVNRSLGARAGIAPSISVDAKVGGDQSTTVTANEVRKQTQESIFNGVRSALDGSDLLKRPESPWINADWREGDFVDFSPGRTIIPLVSVLARLRLIAESFAFATSELSSESLQGRVPQILALMRDESDGGTGTAARLEEALTLVSESGQVARALGGVISLIEEDARASGVIDVVMFEGQFTEPTAIAVASLDREYVDTKLLRRLGQGTFGVLGKVLRAPQDGTALNAFRNSMFGATNQLPVLLSHLTNRLFELPLLLGDSVGYRDETGNEEMLDFVGSPSAITELRPLWLLPSIEILPIAIYA